MQGNAFCKGPQRGAAVAVRLHGDGEASLEVFWGVESIMLQRSKDFCGEKKLILACVSPIDQKGLARQWRLFESADQKTTRDHAS